MSTGQGFWPAIWMMPQKSVYGGWPNSGEIDIMEHLNFDMLVYQSVHSNYVDIQGQKQQPLYSKTARINTQLYNVYGIEWFPDRIDFYVNNVRTMSYTKNTGADNKQWPFDQNFYLILNQALGGDWAGPVKDADLPAQLLIDWVRVYQQS